MPGSHPNLELNFPRTASIHSAVWKRSLFNSPMGALASSRPKRKVSPWTEHCPVSGAGLMCLLLRWTGQKALPRAIHFPMPLPTWSLPALSCARRLAATCTRNIISKCCADPQRQTELVEGQRLWPPPQSPLGENLTPNFSIKPSSHVCEAKPAAEEQKTSGRAGGRVQHHLQITAMGQRRSQKLLGAIRAELHRDKHFSFHRPQAPLAHIPLVSSTTA